MICCNEDNLICLGRVEMGIWMEEERRKDKDSKQKESKTLNSMYVVSFGNYIN